MDSRIFEGMLTGVLILGAIIGIGVVVASGGVVYLISHLSVHWK